MHWQLSKMPRARLRQLTRMEVASNCCPSRLSTSRAVSDGLWPMNHSLPYRGVYGTAHICACTIRTFQRSTCGMPILGPSPMNPTQPSQVLHLRSNLGLVGTNGAAPSLRRLRHEYVVLRKVLGVPRYLMCSSGPRHPCWLPTPAAILGFPGSLGPNPCRLACWVPLPMRICTCLAHVHGLVVVCPYVPAQPVSRCRLVCPPHHTLPTLLAGGTPCHGCSHQGRVSPAGHDTLAGV